MRTIANNLSASRRSAAFAALLALCLLFAQAIGFAHAYAHANPSTEAAASTETASGANDKLFDHAKSAGACASFDAIALASGVHSADVSLPVAEVDAAAIFLTRQSQQARRFNAHFSPRAPPPQA